MWWNRNNQRIRKNTWKLDICLLKLKNFNGKQCKKGGRRLERRAKKQAQSSLPDLYILGIPEDTTEQMKGWKYQINNRSFSCTLGNNPDLQTDKFCEPSKMDDSNFKFD